jgi:hypothetical protein
MRVVLEGEQRIPFEMAGEEFEITAEEVVIHRITSSPPLSRAAPP